jgi:hypothetical protein
MLVKDYRGNNTEQEIWKFDAALVAQICDVLNQTAIEEGQWTEKRDAKGSVGMSVMMERLNAGRKRVADAKAARDAAALTKTQPRAGELIPTARSAQEDPHRRDGFEALMRGCFAASERPPIEASVVTGVSRGAPG